MPAGLTEKQRRFVEEYLIDLNATRAAIRAGYSEKTAYSIGHENLSKPEIADAIAEAKEARSERTKITADYVLQKAVSLLETNISSFLEAPEGGGMPYFDLSKATEEQLAAIESLHLDTAMERDGEDSEGNPQYSEVRKIKVGLPKKKELLELIGRHIDVQAFKDKMEHSGSFTVTVPEDDAGTL